MLRGLMVAVCVAGVVGISGLASAADVTVAGDVERYASTTADQKLEFSSSALTQLRGFVKEVTRSTETARRDGDVEQLQCLTNRLTSLRALLQVSESADSTMRSSLQQGSSDLANHEFRKIAVAHSKSLTLSSEASRCTNETASNSGDTTVRVDAPIEAGDGMADIGFVVEVGFDAPEGSPFN
jgi:hypothetical protein